MGRLEVACRRFAVLSGIRQEPGDFTTCVLPRGASGQRHGLLALVTEPAGEHPSLAAEACRLVQEVVTREYYTGEVFSLTSGLLRALDAANSALLNYNYGDDASTGDNGPGGVAVQSGGVRTRRAQVGLSAVLLRPDGAGIYLAQLAPTQAYIVHDGMLTALPEPASWAPRGGKVAVQLKRVPAPGEEDEEEEEEDLPLGPETLHARNLPALPLGSGPGVDVDLIYRRVEPGDLVIVVSTSLARHIDRAFAEDVFSVGDPDFIADALFELATEHGLAQSHACAMKIGAEATSGIDTDVFVPVSPAGGVVESAVGEVVPAPQPSLPGLANVLRGPKEWFARRRTGPLGEAEQQAEVEPEAELFEGEPVVQPDEHDEAPLPVFPVSQEPEDEVGDPLTAAAQSVPGQPVLAYEQEPNFVGPLQPTQVLLQHNLEIPPYKAQEASAPLAPAAQEELDFDGWEDQPPVFLGRSGKFSANRHPSEWAHGTAALEQKGQIDPDQPVPETASYRTGRSRFYPVPTLFDQEAEESESLLRFPDQVRPTGTQPPQPYAPPAGADPSVASPARKPRLTPVTTNDIRAKTLQALAWGRNLAGSMLPDRNNSGQARSQSRLMVPARLAIAAGLVIVIAVLGFSLFKSAGGAKHNEAARLLQEAKQEETLGNQPDLAAADKLQHLQNAAQKVQAALVVDPGASDAQLFATTVQGEIDTLQGISRVDSKLLFDLDEVDKAGANQTPGDPSKGAAAAASASEPVTSTAQLSAIIQQGNDAYVLDKEKGRVYKCGLVSHDCAAMLKAGDDTGGQKVGSLVAMTLRVGNLTVLDNNLVAFIYNADTSGWQAQALGGANGLDKPKDLASYDGNLYLLGSKPGQIEKYPAGQYGQPPVDWVQDAAAVDQLKNAVSFAIDGSIYALLPDGKIAVMEGGKIVRTITPKEGPQASAPTSLVTGTDLQGLYLLRGKDSIITRLNKDGLTVANLKPADVAASGIGGLSVDEGRGKMYLLQGRKVYEAGLTAHKTNAAPDPLQASDVQSTRQQTANQPASAPPGARPTAAP